MNIIIYNIIMDKYFHDFRNDEFANKYIFKNKQNGYFVEVGGCDGINGSQCYYFEKNLNWNGIVVEPQKIFHEYLKKNRKNYCFNCLGNETTIIDFTECNSNYHGYSGVTSVLRAHEKYNPKKTQWRDYKQRNYNVEMITLIQLLEKYNSPNVIDYLGMDCEGSEYNILTHFFENNKKYLIKFICLEVGHRELADLVLKNDYLELTNPLLPDWNGKKVTWERYFIHKSEIDTIDKQIWK